MAMPQVWTDKLRSDFYTAVAELHKIDQCPLAPVSYTLRTSQDPNDAYLLTLRDELRLADRIALLAATQHGSRGVSAVCVEQWPTCLVLRLACNATPAKITTVALEKILNTASRGARLGLPKQKLSDDLFDDVFHLSKRRILQRIYPTWSSLPGQQHHKRGALAKVPSPLEIDLKPVESYIKGLPLSHTVDSLRVRIQALVASLHALKFSRTHTAQMDTIMKHVVRDCAALTSRADTQSSLQEQLDGLNMDFRCEKVIIRINKLAAYRHLCDELIMIFSRRQYQTVILNVQLIALTAPHAIRLKGASKRCYVHAEVQLIQYYVKSPCPVRPRAIGCSKSACLLCDMLIRNMGPYSISRAHQRLYPQWTVADSAVSEADQKRMQEVLGKMTEELFRLAAEQRKSRTAGSIPLAQGVESVANTLLSGHMSMSHKSNASNATLRLKGNAVAAPERGLERCNSQQPEIDSVPVSVRRQPSVLLPEPVDPPEDPQPSLAGLAATQSDAVSSKVDYHTIMLASDGTLAVVDCPPAWTGKVSCRWACTPVDSTIEENRKSIIALADIKSEEITVSLNPMDASSTKISVCFTPGLTLDVEVEWPPGPSNTTGVVADEPRREL